MGERPRGEPDRPRPIDEHFGALVRAWARRLRRAGFTDQQVARLIYAKLLYIRGHLRR